MYATSPEFLEVFGLHDLEGLPDLEEFKELEERGAQEAADAREGAGGDTLPAPSRGGEEAAPLSGAEAETPAEMTGDAQSASPVIAPVPDDERSGEEESRSDSSSPDREEEPR